MQKQAVQAKMRTLVTCQDKSAGSGYTLLEVLLILMMMALLSGIALPRFSNMLESYLFRLRLDDIERRLSELGVLAHRQGKRIVVTSFDADSSQAAPLVLPASWSLQTEQPIHYNAKGVCSGGRITITSQAYAVEYQIHAPDGRLQKNGMAAR